MNNLSENLKKIRKDNHLSQEQLADDLGVSRQAISKWESGVAYPEMEKIVQICQKFELNIDDLLNKDIREVKREQESRNNLNKYIDDFLHFITDTVNLFSNMSFKTKLKCIFEQILITVILLILLLIIGSIGNMVINSILYDLLPHNIYYKIFDILTGIYLVFGFIIVITILVHIFKIRYLDYYKNIKNSVKLGVLTEDGNSQSKIDDKEKTNDRMTIDNKNKILFQKNKDKIIIRDPKHSEYKFINGIFKGLVLFVKFFALLGALFLCLMIIGFVAGFIISFTVAKTGIFFIGLLLSMLSLTVGTLVVTLMLFNFIFNRKNDKKKTIWCFIISIILFGISCGFICIGALKFNVVNDTSKNLLETITLNIDMQDDLTIAYDNFEYVEKDIDNVIIEYDINKKFELDYDMWYSHNKKVLHYWSYSSNPFGIIRTVIDEINKYNIINLNNDILNVKIYASRNNIEKLKTNRLEYDNSIKTQQETNDYYEERINELETELEQKQNELYELQERIDNIENTIVE